MYTMEISVQWWEKIASAKLSLSEAAAGVNDKNIIIFLSFCYFYLSN